jgi:hypothetical protein
MKHRSRESSLKAKRAQGRTVVARKAAEQTAATAEGRQRVINKKPADVHV